MPSLHDLIEKAKRTQICGADLQRVKKDHFPQLQWVINEARDAVCFDMGDIELMPALKFNYGLFRMPYPVTWFEGKFPNGFILGFLASETGPDQWDIATFNKVGGRVWLLLGINRFTKPLDPDAGILDYTSVLVFNDESHEYCLQSVSNNLAFFIMALNCSNVKRAEHPAPKFLNRERAKKGKQPLFSYWTLHLPGENGSSIPMGGTHASPRVHLRRGHIREYAPGKFTWINAHAVGNKKAGLIMKDYAYDHDSAPTCH